MCESKLQRNRLLAAYRKIADCERGRRCFMRVTFVAHCLLLRCTKLRVFRVADICEHFVGEFSLK